MARSLLFRGALVSLVCVPLIGVAWSRESLVGVLTSLGLYILLLGVVSRRPLAELRAERLPLDPAVRDVLQARVPFFAELEAQGQERFQRRVQRLLQLTDFEAVGEAEFDDELRVLAVAGAAVVAHGLPTYRFSTRRSVLLYPDHFDDEYNVDGNHRIAGMVHHQGPIVFSRAALLDGWARTSDARNVSIHEWAHVLDLDDGFADGVPGFVGDLARWNEVVESELERARDGRHTALREYAGTNRAETFAVAVEVFFERPARLKKKNEALYELLAEALAQRPE